MPVPPLATLARLLFKRNQPVALDGAVVGQEIGIGRAGPLDDADAAQKRLPAALSVKRPSGPIKR